jgi:hypothetical protein
MAEQLTDRHALPLLQAGQAQKEMTHNEALVRLDLLTMAAARGIANAPPAAPVPGECWIVGDSPAGSWAGHADALAGWTESGWRFVAARSGMRVWLNDAACDARFFDGAWNVPARPAIPVPSGGETVDLQAREAIAAMLSALAMHGLTGR